MHFFIKNQRKEKISVNVLKYVIKLNKQNIKQNLINE